MSTDKKPDIKDKATKEKDAEAIEHKEQEKSKVPKQPECDPKLGDLTPEFIAWVKKYHPDDFEARYKGRIPEVPEDKE